MMSEAADAEAEVFGVGKGPTGTEGKDFLIDLHLKLLYLDRRGAVQKKVKRLCDIIMIIIK